MPFETLVKADILAARLGNPDWVVLDCRFDLADPDAGRRAFTESHIPGAHYLHLDEDLSGPKTPHSGRHPLPDPRALAQRLGRLGVTAETQIVAYDGAGGAIAARLWWLLRWLGHPRVAVLDGGLAEWRRSGFAISDQETPLRPAKPLPLQVQSEALVDAEQLVQAQGQGCLVLDARAAERFSGEVEPLDAVAGHIPGAVNLPFAGNLTASGTFLSPGELRDRFRTVLGEVAPTQVIHMCGSGVTACHNLLAMAVADCRGARLYAGSWSEWIKDPARAVTKTADRAGR